MEARKRNALLRKTIQVRRLRHGTANAEIAKSDVVADDQQDVRGLTCALISGTLRRRADGSLRCGFVYRGAAGVWPTGRSASCFLYFRFLPDPLCRSPS